MQESGSQFSTLLSLLVRLRPYARGAALRRLYWALHDIWESDGPPVRTHLHGFSVLLNRGNNYPFLVDRHPLFNAPLVELVYQSSRHATTPLTLVDVGAATGDTVFLVKDRCQGMVGKFLCVEGDTEFHTLLAANMSQFRDVQVINALLASESRMIRSLVKEHQGTATAAGDSMVPAVRLDSLACINSNRIDILKIDVDGFDGDVLAGATAALNASRPAVIFEWHPRLIASAGNDPMRAFNVLLGCGYTRFLWFNNVGTFSHFDESFSEAVIQKWIRYIMAQKSDHFDIIALPCESEISDVDLALLGFARGSGAPR